MGSTRIQLCGRLVVELEGERVERRLPGRQGRLLFVYLALNRLRPVSRDELVDALWPNGLDGGLAPLLSKLRRIVPVDGTNLAIPDAWIDFEVAAEAVHRAESAVARAAWADAWGPSRVALHIASRSLLPEEDLSWVEDARRRLDDLRIRALECTGAAGLALGGPELASATRSGQELVRLEPYRESGHRLLMEALDREGNRAEALRIYESLRERLRADLGVSPSAPTQELHRRLLQ